MGMRKEAKTAKRQAEKKLQCGEMRNRQRCATYEGYGYCPKGGGWEGKGLTGGCLLDKGEGRG